MASVASSMLTKSAAEVLAESLEDPAVRAEWVRTAPARAVALRLVEYRVEHGLTLTELGRKLGMSPRTIARLEAGDQSPSIETLVRLTERLGMSFQFEIRPAGEEPRAAPSVDGAAKIVERVTTAKGAEVVFAAG